MPDLQKGYQFSGTSPNNSVTAEKLNTLVDGATILAGFYTGKSESVSADDADYLLFHEASSGAYRKIRKGNLITASRSQTGFRNLVAKNNTATPATQVDVIADEVVMRSDTGNVWYSGGLNTTLDITSYAGASTANGRDFATLTSTSGQWCGIWAISNGGLDRLLFSLAATPFSAPNLPAGFPYKALLGVVWLNPAGTLISFVQRGNEVAIPAASPGGSSSALLNPYLGANELKGNSTAGGTGVVNATARTFSAVNLSRCIPPVAVACRGIFGATTDLGAAGSHVVYAVASKGTGALNASPADVIGLQLFHDTTSPTQTFGFRSAITFEVPIHTPQTISCAASTTDDAYAMRITGYALNLGS